MGMKAKEIAQLIMLVADSTIAGRTSLETDTRLNGALWRLAHRLGVEEMVDHILQNSSMDEMKKAMKEMGVEDV
jgi:hypothetical protein